MKKYKYVVILMLSLFMLFGCEKENKQTNETPKTEKKAALTLTFKPKFEGQDLVFNKMTHIIQASDTLNFSRVQLILSNFELIKENGETVKLDTFAYLNLAEKRNEVKIDETMPEGTFKGIKFMIGLDSSINHGDPNRWSKNHPLNPIVNNMHWGWQGGYIFWVCEGYYMNNGNSNQIFSFHMANLKYRKQITLETSNTFSFDNNNKIAKVIDVNLDKYFSTPNQYSLKTNGDLSHSSSPDEDLIMDLLYTNLSNTFELK
ncbi:MAG: hypothetical protein M0R38_03230 [Bacteroidia bacterium]|nr:hypothetical protein [Bacteroidia bacterium]